MILSHTEENYLKGLLKLTGQNKIEEAGTNELAKLLEVKPASVNIMLKRLKAKKLIDYKKYGKIKLNASGKKQATQIVRKHRLWETFLHEKLGFTWDEVHAVAEQLEHIQSSKLIDKLDEFLGFPSLDPHGDPIPNAKGQINIAQRKTLKELSPGESGTMIAVKDNSSTFLQYIVKSGLGINTKIKVLSRQEFDGSIEIQIKKLKQVVSQKLAENIYVE